jgi:hypothetical protein
MRSTLTFKSKSPAPGPGFQGEVRKRHLSMPPLKRALRPPPGPLSGSLWRSRNCVPAGAHEQNSAKPDQGFDVRQLQRSMCHAAYATTGRS